MSEFQPNNKDLVIWSQFGWGWGFGYMAKRNSATWKKGEVGVQGNTPRSFIKCTGQSDPTEAVPGIH